MSYLGSIRVQNFLMKTRLWFAKYWHFLPVLLGLTLVAVYWQGLAGGFFFDDEPNILRVEAIQLDSLSVESIRQAWNSGFAGPLGRPISQVSFAFNYYFSGFSPFAFKLTNLALHGLNGILVYLIALRLFAATSPDLTKGEARLRSYLAAAIWLLHPIQLTSVLYVVQRMTSLSASFLLLAFLLHVSSRQHERLALKHIYVLMFAWGVVWPLSLLSKESGALFPGFVAAYELIIRRAAYQKLDGFGRILLWCVGGGAAAALVYLFTPAAQWLWAGYEFRSFSLVERLLTEGRVLCVYLGLIFMPRMGEFALYHDDIVISTSLINPWTTLPALAGLMGLVACAWWYRSKFPLLSFSIAWFMVAHSLESTALPLEIAHEHRNYVGLFGIILAPLWGLSALISHAGTRRTLGISLAVALLGYLGLVTALRSHQSGNEVLRTQLETQYHPGSPRAHYEAAAALARQLSGDPRDLFTYVMARKHYEKAGTLDKSFKLSWLGLVHLNCMTGQKVEAAWTEELAHRLQFTPFAPGDASVLYSLKEMAIAGTLCLTRQDMQALFNAALSNNAASHHVRAKLYSWLADYLLLRERDLPAAQHALGQSLILAPANASNRLKWAQLLFLLGQEKEALQWLNALNNESLTRSEQKTRKNLLDCLASESKGCRVIPPIVANR